jgi:hypothetical protein
MAKVVLTNPRVTLDLYDLSDHITSLSIDTNYDLVEVTNVGDTAKKMVAGLAENSVTFDFQQDFAASSYVSPSGVDAVIFPKLGLKIGCTVRPTSAAISATNPEYQFDVIVSQWSPLSGGVGELATTQVQWPIYGAITKDITP